MTCVANVTGLDWIGIPLYLSVRPNSRSIFVAQRKGVDSAAAKVSSIVEAIETQQAEFNSCLTRLESYAALRGQGAVADPQALLMRQGSLFSERRAIPWTFGFDLLRSEPKWVPFELVHANATVPAVPGSGCFASSTNGLASSNNACEAIPHGLYEVIERDALAIWEHSAPARWKADRLDWNTDNAPVFAELIGRLENAGISVIGWNSTSDVGLPAFFAIIFDKSRNPLLKPLPAAAGAGCHLDREVALARALTEEAQSRLTAFAGICQQLATANRTDKRRQHTRLAGKRRALRRGFSRICA
jgi:YcaO-like protein with predicted kinase domain